MSCLNQYALLILIFTFLRTLKADDNFFDLSTSTQSETFSLNGSVTIICTVYKNRAGISDGVQWFRRQGTLRFMIASDLFPSIDFDGNQRYTFERGSDTSTTFSYIMKIRNLQLQDSATIECGNPRFTNRASMAFAVCDDPNSDNCDCMVVTGWASPTCFNNLIDAKATYDGHHRAVVGLGVGLAFAIILAIALTVFFVKNCTRYISAYMKDKKETARLTENTNPPPVHSAAAPGAGVLKHQSHTSVPAGHSVRFSGDKSDAENQPSSSRQAVNQGARPKERISSISGRLYPSLDAITSPTPDSTARNHDFQTIAARGYVDAQDTSSQIYETYGLPYSGQPYVPQQPYMPQQQPSMPQQQPSMPQQQNYMYMPQQQPYMPQQQPSMPQQQLYVPQQQPYMPQQQPYVPQQLAFVGGNEGAVLHNPAPVFIDPGSTSI